MTPPPPWMYQPQAWDTEEVKEEFAKNPPATDIPNEITVTVREGPDASSFVLKAMDNLLQIGETSYPYTSIRYVTTYCRAFTVESHPYIILVSVRINCGFGIGNMFITADDAASTLAILNFFQYHIFQFLRLSLGQEDPSVVQQYLRPLIAHPFMVQVHYRQTGNTIQERRILLLDQECVSLYLPKPYQAEASDPPMYFWREMDVKSVSKVSHILSASCILFQSPELYIVVPYNQDMAPDLESEIRNVGKGDTPKKAFAEPRVLLQWLSEDYHEEMEEPMIKNFEPIEIGHEQNEQIGKLERELQEGMKGFLGSPSAQVWFNQESTLKNQLRTNSLPHPGDRPRDFSANNVDNLLDMIQRTEELLFVKIDFSLALATTLMTKQLFLESRVPRIRALMEQEDAMSLLKMIYARGNVSTRNSRPDGRQNIGDDDDDDMIGGFADEEDQ